MKTYVLMTKFATDFTKKMEDREELGRDWLEQVKKTCPDVKFILHYALLGDYDFMDIYEAPDEETAAKVSLISRKNGAFKAQSWPAIPYKQFLDLVKEI